VKTDMATGIPKAQAELLAERELLHDAKSGALNGTSVREFIVGLEQSRQRRQWIKAIFDKMVASKRAASMPRIQAELVASRQLVREAKAGELDEDLVREFVLAVAGTHGITAEAAQLNVDALFSGSAVKNNPTDLGLRQMGNEQVG
jgi:cytochrome P450